MDNLRLRMQAQEQWLKRLKELVIPKPGQPGNNENTVIDFTEDRLPVVERLRALIRFQSMMQEHYEALIEEFQNEGT